MPVNSSNRGGFRGGWRGNKRKFITERDNAPSSSQLTQPMQGGSTKPQNYNLKKMKANNPLNQYYVEQFIKLKNDSDFKNMRNQSYCYKRVIIALSKYPMPILCPQQTQFLEGVGDTVAIKFTQMIQDREKEFEDGLFFSGLAHDQKKAKQRQKKSKWEAYKAGDNPLESDGDDYSLSQKDEPESQQLKQDHDNVLKNFAGININAEMKVDAMNMSMKQFLIAQDKINFQSNFGRSEEPATKKRPKPDVDEDNKMEEDLIDDEGGVAKKHRKFDYSDFLEVGSLSWSLMIALYFLALHDDSKDMCATFESVQDMLNILTDEFGDMLPLITNLEELIKGSPYELQKLREHSFIELVDGIERDRFLWRMIMTSKGIKRAKGLCKAVGLLVNIEVDLNDKSRNKITINMYDRNLMPIVEDLYYTDQTQLIKAVKQDGILDGNISKCEDGTLEDIQRAMAEGREIQGHAEKQTAFFSSFILQIEDDVIETLGLNNSIPEDHIGNQNKKLANPPKPQKGSAADMSIMQEIFEEAKNEQLQGMVEDLQIVDAVEGKIVKQKRLSSSEDDNKRLFDVRPVNGGVPNSDKDTYGDFEVMLIVDNREKRNNQDINYFYDRFKASQLQTELANLPLGDFLWVIRMKNNQSYEDDDQIEETNNPDPDQQDFKRNTKTKKKGAGKKIKKPTAFTDYVLDFIVERKTADDLAASIMDGRYEEQKFRLKNCGINNVIYLVEGTPGQYCKIPEQVLRKACIHTQIFHSFNVMRIPTIQESLKWLTQMTKEIQTRMTAAKKSMGRQFEQTIKDTLIDFKQFTNESSKSSNLNVQQIFARQLRTVKGLGIDNCSSITRVFKTPRLLDLCYEKCENEIQMENLLNAGKLELMKSQYAYKDNIGTSTADFKYRDFIPAEEMGNPDLPRCVEDVDKINLINVISTAIPKFYNRLHKEFGEATGVPVRKINKTQSQNMRKLFITRGTYADVVA